MYRSLTFAIELALIEYFINELLLVFKIWNEPFINVQKISYYFIVKILINSMHTLILSSSEGKYRSYCDVKKQVLI
jgi:hypothetical protein